MLWNMENSSLWENNLAIQEQGDQIFTTIIIGFKRVLTDEINR